MAMYGKMENSDDVPITNDTDELTVTLPDTNIAASERYYRTNKCKTFIYKALTSNFGLFIFLVVYTCAAATIFQAVESGQHGDHFVSKKKETVNITAFIIQLKKAQKNGTDFFETNIQAQDVLSAYEEALHMSREKEEEMWTYLGAYFYCGTVFTTIGYGHITPHTKLGKVLTILLALIGIPLFFRVLFGIGKVLAEFLNTILLFCLKRFQRQHDFDSQDDKTQPIMPVIVTAPIAIVILVVYIIIGGAIYAHFEDWSFADACYFIVISILSIGFGDLVSVHPNLYFFSPTYIFVGMILVAMVAIIISQTITRNRCLADTCSVSKETN